MRGSEKQFVRDSLIVVFKSEVRDEVFAFHVAEGVFELHELDEDVVFGIEAGGGHGAFEVEAEPLLDAAHTGALGEVHKEDEVEDEGGGEDGVAAEEIDFDLHRVAEPAEDVDVVPAFFGVAAGRIVVDLYGVVEVFIELRVEVGLEDLFENAELGFLFGFEGAGIFEHFAIAVAEDVGGEPAADAQHAGLEAWGEQGLHEGLAGFEVFAADGDVVVAGEIEEGGDVVGEVGRAVGEGGAGSEGGVGVDLAGGDVGVVRFEALFEGFEGLVDGGGAMEDFGGAAPDHDEAGAVVVFAEFFDVGDQLFGEVAFVRARLHVGTVDALDVLLVEDGLHGFDGREGAFNLVEEGLFEDACMGGCLVGRVFVDVPTAEDEIVEFGERNEVLDLGSAVLGTFTEADGGQLRERADGLAEASFNEFDTSHKRGCNSTDSWNENSELTFGWSNAYRRCGQLFGLLGGLLKGSWLKAKLIY